MQPKLPGALLAAALALPLAAQTESKPVDRPDGPTEKVWMLQTSGLGG